MKNCKQMLQIVMMIVSTVALFYLILRVVQSLQRPELVVIQNVQDNVHGDRNYCTQDQKDCTHNQDFFNDTWYTGNLDMDPTTHLDMDGKRAQWVQD